MVAATRPATEYYPPTTYVTTEPAPAPAPAYVPPPCNVAPIEVSGVPYYNCGKTWYTEGYASSGPVLCRFHRLPDTERWGCRKDRRAADDRAWSMENGDLYRL